MKINDHGMDFSIGRVTASEHHTLSIPKEKSVATAPFLICSGFHIARRPWPLIYGRVGRLG